MKLTFLEDRKIALSITKQISVKVGEEVDLPDEIAKQYEGSKACKPSKDIKKGEVNAALDDKNAAEKKKAEINKLAAEKAKKKSSK